MGDSYDRKLETYTDIVADAVEEDSDAETTEFLARLVWSAETAVFDWGTGDPMQVLDHLAEMKDLTEAEVISELEYHMASYTNRRAQLSWLYVNLGLDREVPESIPPWVDELPDALYDLWFEAESGEPMDLDGVDLG
jgi:hypothetical protein